MSGEVPTLRVCDNCGGVARQLPSSGEEWDGFDLYHYRCDDCREGGHIALSHDRARCEGPVFNAARYRQSEIATEQFDSAAPTVRGEML